MPVYQRVNTGVFEDNADLSIATETNSIHTGYRHTRMNTEDEIMDFKNDEMDIMQNNGKMRKITMESIDIPTMGMDGSDIQTIPEYHRVDTYIADDDSLDSDNEQNYIDLYGPGHVRKIT